MTTLDDHDRWARRAAIIARLRHLRRLPVVRRRRMLIARRAQ